MNIWLLAATVLMLCLVPCGILCVRGRPWDALAGMSTGSVVVTLTAVLLAVGFDRSIYLDVALVVSVLSFAGVMVFVRYLERWG